MQSYVEFCAIQSYVAFSEMQSYVAFCALQSYVAFSEMQSYVSHLVQCRAM